MKADRNYKMTKGTKTYMMFIADPHERGIFKNLMVEAESHAEISRKKKLIKISDSEE